MTSRVTVLAVIAMAGLAFLPDGFAKAGGVEPVSLSPRLFLGRVNNWMIWEFEGNEGRFCFITSSPEGTSPLRHRSPELWMTQRPIHRDDGGKEHVFEVSFTSDEIAEQGGARMMQINVVGQNHPMVFGDDRFWLEAEPDEVTEFLERMLDLETAYQKKKERDPRSEPNVPMIEVQRMGGQNSGGERFSLLGFTKAKETIEDNCAARPERA